MCRYENIIYFPISEHLARSLEHVHLETLDVRVQEAEMADPAAPTETVDGDDRDQVLGHPFSLPDVRLMEDRLVAVEPEVALPGLEVVGMGFDQEALRVRYGLAKPERIEPPVSTE